MKKTWVWVVSLAVVLTACSGKTFKTSPSAPSAPVPTNTPTFTVTGTSTGTPTVTATPTAALPDFNLSGAVTTLNTGTYNFNCVHLSAGAVVTINGGVTIFCQCFTLDAGATITGVGQGYNTGAPCGHSPVGGPGCGSSQMASLCNFNVAGGGGHGAPGTQDCFDCNIGVTVCANGGVATDDSVHPTLMGGSGGYGSCDAPGWGNGAGGGLLKAVVFNSASNTLAPITVNGTIDMSGAPGITMAGTGRHNGGGAGGTILVEASVLGGHGALVAAGGDSNWGKGYGGGGIISLISDTTPYTGTTSVRAGFTSPNIGIVTVTPPPLSGY